MHLSMADSSGMDNEYVCFVSLSLKHMLQCPIGNSRCCSGHAIKSCAIYCLSTFSCCRQLEGNDGMLVL